MRLYFRKFLKQTRPSQKNGLTTYTFHNLMTYLDGISAAKDVQSMHLI